MHTMDQYFLVQAPNWVGTMVPLRFWAKGTVFFMIFHQFLTLMGFERLPNHNDYKLNNKLRDLTS